MKIKWIEKNTFHHSKFADIPLLIKLKEKKKKKISVAFPTLNEEKTIGKEVEIIRRELMERYPLVDQIAVIDSGSTDKTLEVASSAGAEVYLSRELLPHLGDYPGKGENLWKSLYILEGDIIVWIDGDIANIHPKFVYGLVGPLLHYDRICFVKAFYQRPLCIPGEEHDFGGGRVTEILVRPLFSCFFPELTQLYQPCSGECAGKREVLEKLSFASGYGIETGMLIDIYTMYGPKIIAQVDLDLRIHRNQPATALGKMGFEILHTFLKRASKLNQIELKKELAKVYRRLECGPEHYRLREEKPQLMERPPMVSIAEYSKRTQSPLLGV